MSNSFCVYRPTKTVTKDGQKKTVKTRYYWARLPGPDGKPVRLALTAAERNEDHREVGGAGRATATA